MSISQVESLNALYHEDETAWLEVMAELVAQRHFAELDHHNLGEFLQDMAKRDRREVYSRLVVLMCHLLKWAHQPERQSGSWRGTIREQRLELRLLLESATLKNHARQVLTDAYNDARKRAADESELALDQFPQECTWDVDDLLGED